MKIGGSKFLYRLKSLFNGHSLCGYDLVTPGAILILLLMGIGAIYSSQSYRGGVQWQAQIGWAALGALLYICASRMDYGIFLRYAHWIYLLSIVLLLCLWSPLGERHFGALRWIKLGGFAVQPSEPAKLGFLIMAAAMVARSEMEDLTGSLREILKFLLVFCAPMLLIFLQPDLGSALTFPPILFAMLYVANLSQKFFICVISCALVLLSIVAFDIFSYRLFLDRHGLNPVNNMGLYEKHSILPLKDYQRNRIISFVAPDVVDPSGVGVSWNLKQSLIAVGTGGIVGKGFNNGMQAKLGYLPKSVASNDFIFSVIGEERGFLGSSIVLLAYFVLIFNGLRIATLSRDRFGTYLAVGISVLFLTHICINVGMTLGLMPITGIPLPFLSYGGSFLLICCFLQGMIQSIYRFRMSYE
ncbi:MAG: rod shape-determining protein RodA [Puniceicoccales bacterium]|jgi:rod shape determining protein RodA|nr:rod shape-determining protein RodA [Puniceicoccales bacterium]